MWSDKKYLDAYQDGYPGYTHAQRMPTAAIYGGYFPDGRTIAGTTFYEVIGLERTGTGYTARICEYNSRASGQDEAGNYYDPNPDPATPRGQSSTMTFGPDPAVQPAQQHSPPTNQKGPASRPTDDVFGTWIVTDIAASRTPFPECQKLAPGTPPHQALPAPALPPEPGWPDAGSA
ncbi:hypothetical protein [Mycobacteroides salmoniphilum]|nr:hypothetical protein [Mycobacteroides salmoniphilum]